MEDVTSQAETSLSKFSYALDQLEQTIRPVLKAFDELRASGNEDDLDPMSRARMHISLCYSVNTLFCMYLRTQGVDPATHPVSEEIGRVQDAFMRMRKVEAGISVDHQPPPDRDRRRHMVNAKKSAQRLASLVFPEEVDLLDAIRGKKRKREVKDDEKTDKVCSSKKSLMLTSGSELDSDEVEDNSRKRKCRRKEKDAHMEDLKRGDHSTDSFSDDDRRVKEKEALETQKQGKTESPGEDASEKKKRKKKKKSKNKSKDSGLDSKRKRSKGKKDKDQMPAEAKHSEKKRKRRKKTEE